MNRQQLRALLGDIRFWIFVFFVLRLVGITNAPLEGGHNWRQALTGMMTRNFLDFGPDLLNPMIDQSGEHSPIIASEFPLFNYLVYLFHEVFGFAHWHGRLVNLIASSFGLWYFFRGIKAVVNERVAFSATLVLTTSVWFTFSRNNMPDTFSVSLMIAGLFYGLRYLQAGKLVNLLLFGALTAFGMLCKIPALSLFSVLALVLVVKDVPTNRRVFLLTTAALSFGLACVWYFYWVPHQLAQQHYQLFFPKSFAEGIQELMPLLGKTAERFYFNALSSFVGFGCVLYGAFLVLRSKQTMLKLGLGIVTLFFALFIIKTGAVFPLHNYYVVPFVPVLALLAGYGIAQVKPVIAYSILAIIAVEGIANQQHDFFVKDKQLHKLELEAAVDNVVAPNELIVINGGQSPNHIYFAHRKGWTVHNEQLSTPFLDSLHQLGAQFFIQDRTKLPGEFEAYPTVHRDAHYTIYKLETAATLNSHSGDN